MTRTLIGLTLVIALLFQTSCATILTGSQQKVTVEIPEDATLLVEGKEPKFHKGRVRIKKDRQCKQLTVQREGFQDRNVVIAPYKVSPVAYFSLLFFLYPYMIDAVNPKSYTYDSYVDMSAPLVKVPTREEGAKEIRLNSVNVDIDQINTVFYPEYKAFAKGKWSSTYTKNNQEEVKLDNTVFSESLNDILREKGYIDTTNKVLKNSYLNNLLIDATIENYESTSVRFYLYNGLHFVKLGIKWKVLDYYKKEIFSFTTKATSGQFKYLNKDDFRRANIMAIKDALEVGLTQFMEQDEVIKQLNDRSEEEEEKGFQPITLNNTNEFVSSLGDAIKSSVTITNKKGHGSGFVVSNDGYILTNYHVVTETEDLKVVMNNEEEYVPDIVRISKIYDLALLKIDAEGLLPFKMSYSEDIEIAQDVYAVGTPTGTDLNQTISKGIISGVRKNDDGSKLIQTDASINAGNSGGAIVTTGGVVLGIVSSKYFGFGVEGVAFGIPAHYVQDKMKLEY